MQRTNHPVETLAASVYDAAHLSLPEVHYESVDYAAVAQEREDALKKRRPAKRMAEMPTVMKTRRPRVEECEVVAMFPQSWGSTALGFGGLGGAAITSAYTIVVRGPCGTHAVYWAGRLAYLVPSEGLTEAQKRTFAEDLAGQTTHSRCEAGEAYGAVVPGVQAE